MSKKFVIYNLVIENIALSSAVVFAIVAFWLFGAAFYFPDDMQQIANYAWIYTFITILLLALWLRCIPLTHEFKIAANVKIRTIIFEYKKKYFPKLLNKKNNIKGSLSRIRNVPGALPKKKLSRCKTVEFFDASSLRSASQGVDGKPEFCDAFFEALFVDIGQTGEQFSGELQRVLEFKDALAHLVGEQKKNANRTECRTFSHLGSNQLRVAGTLRSRSYLDRMVCGKDPIVERALRFERVLPGHVIEIKQ